MKAGKFLALVFVLGLLVILGGPTGAELPKPQGEDNRHISTTDANGVALAAIQGLYETIQEKDAQIAALEARLEALVAKLAQEQ